jgi:tRNA pseudouridine13 synthase
VLSFKSAVDSFFVEEIPAYLPAGEGEHTFVWIEKRDLTTIEAVRRLAQACGVDARDVGYAGMKDRHATTRQWLSLPRVDPERALGAAAEGIKILEARRHGNKLRTGHLRGNRFEVVLTGAAAGDAARVGERLRAMARDGLANKYGDQRFGAAGDNAAEGLAILRGTRRERDHRRRRLLMSAAQSAVFNRYLELRAADADGGGLLRVRAGDVLQKTDSGGLFVSADPAVDQARVDARQVLPTGPMPGTRVMEPPEGSAARAIEDQALAAVGATREDFARGGRDLPGARRAVVVMVELDEAGDPVIANESDPDQTLRIKFGLPAGSYATVVIESLLH